jgi:hypothetical protein
MRTIDELKSQGQYREAGAEAFRTGRDRGYGCHFGMRSTRDYARREYEAGWDEAQQGA